MHFITWKTHGFQRIKWVVRLLAGALFLRGKCESSPVILGHAAAGGNTGSGVCVYRYRAPARAVWVGGSGTNGMRFPEQGRVEQVNFRACLA